MNIEKIVGYELLQNTIGIPEIAEISNDFEEHSPGDKIEDSNHYQKIVLQIKEEEPEIYAIGILFSLALMSFSYAVPRGYSEDEFIPDEDWNLGYFVKGLSFEKNRLCFSADYVSSRLMKTDISFDATGTVTLETSNRGKEANRWISHLS